MISKVGGIGVVLSLIKLAAYCHWCSVRTAEPEQHHRASLARLLGTSLRYPGAVRAERDGSVCFQSLWQTHWPAQDCHWCPSVRRPKVRRPKARRANSQEGKCQEGKCREGKCREGK